MSGSNKMWQKMRKNKARSSPPDQLKFDNDDVAPESFALSSQSSVAMSNSGGFYSTPPSCHADNSGGTCSPLSVSPNTPRKDWEVSLKHYLTDVLGEDKSGEDPSTDGSVTFVGMKVPELRQHAPSYNGHRDTMAASLPPPSMQSSRVRGKSDQGILYNGGSRSYKSSNHLSSGLDGDGTVKFKTPSPPRYISNDPNASFHDEPIHNGKIFSNIFGRRKKDRKGRISEKYQPSDLDKSNKIHSRTKSFGSLDQVMRNGSSTGRDRAFSQSTTLLHPSAGSKLIRPKSHRSGFGNKKDKQRQKKLAFTEHHNSAQYGVDTATAYLGEEKSIQRGSYFAKISKFVFIFCRKKT